MNEARYSFEKKVLASFTPKNNKANSFEKDCRKSHRKPRVNTSKILYSCSKYRSVIWNHNGPDPSVPGLSQCWSGDGPAGSFLVRMS